VAGRIESSGRQASEDLMSRAEMLSSGIKSHVEDAERSLTNLVVNTSETIQTGARAAQQALLTVSTDVGAQLRMTSVEVETALAAVGTGAANTILTRPVMPRRCWSPLPAKPSARSSRCQTMWSARFRPPAAQRGHRQRAFDVGGERLTWVAASVDAATSVVWAIARTARTRQAVALPARKRALHIV